MRRRSTATAMPAPASGARSPEMMLTSVVLPLPERPNSAMMPGVGAAKLASRQNPGRLLSTDTCSMSAAEQAAHAPYQQLAGQEPQQAERQRQRREPQRQSISAG